MAECGVGEADRLRQYRAEAEEAADRLATAWRVAGLPTDPNLFPMPRTGGIPEGPYVSLLGCHARAIRALADLLADYARLTGRLVDTEQPSLLALIMAQEGVTPALPRDGFHVLATESSA